MFDYINFETKCPNCKKRVSEFQSKDGPCMLEHLDFWEVNDFYSHCLKCKTWIEYEILKRPNRKLTIKDYKQNLRIPKDG